MELKNLPANREAMMKLLVKDLQRCNDLSKDDSQITIQYLCSHQDIWEYYLIHDQCDTALVVEFVPGDEGSVDGDFSVYQWDGCPRNIYWEAVK